MIAHMLAGVPRRRSGSRSWSGSARIRGPGCASTAATARKRRTAGHGAPPTYELRDPADRALVPRTSPAALDNGFDAIVGARAAARLRAAGARRARRLAGGAGARWRAARRPTDAAPRARRHPLHLGRGADRRREATCCCSPSTPATSAASSGPSAARWLLILARHPDRLGPAVALPRADHRHSAAPARAGRAPGAARPRARGRRAAPARAPRRDRPARPRAARHDPEPAPADRRHRGLRRRRHPRAQEPARLAALGGRHARAGRGSGASRSRCSTWCGSDVGRLDRLVVDIAEASRLDAELSRARFEPVDLGRADRIDAADVGGARRRAAPQVAFARPRVGSAVDPGRRIRGSPG